MVLHVLVESNWTAGTENGLSRGWTEDLMESVAGVTTAMSGTSLWGCTEEAAVAVQ